MLVALRLPAPHGAVTVTSASHSSAEMLMKFISGDSTGVDCGKKVEKMKGKIKKNSLVLVGLKEELHPMGKLSSLRMTGTINNPPPAPTSPSEAVALAAAGEGSMSPSSSSSVPGAM